MFSVKLLHVPGEFHVVEDPEESMDCLSEEK